MKIITTVAFLLFCFHLQSQARYIDVGEKIIRVNTYSPFGANENMVDRFIKAINSATYVGLLSWKKIQKDSIELTPSRGFTLDIRFQPAQNTIVIGSGIICSPQAGEIVVGDRNESWKSKNLNLVKFLQMYFFGIKN